MITVADRTRITAAIRDAESHTAGEIFALSPDNQATTASCCWAGLPLPLIYLTVGSAPVVYLLQIIAFLGAAAAFSNQRMRLATVPWQARHDHAHAEAMRQFHAQVIDKTEHRTSVLIFASAAERYVEVVTDAGINDRVASSVWEGANGAVATSIKAGRPGDGFVTAIKGCGAVLATHFPPGALKRDELPDKPLEL